MLHTICTKQFLATSVKEVWNFMSSPMNLSRITPSYLGFAIINPQHLTKMYPGQIIEYYIHPVLGIKIHWVTEITQVEEGRYFVDEQRKGPYRIWHHQHILRPVKGGVEMEDLVHYALPLGFIGEIVHSLVVKKQLAEIFSYRTKVLDEMFNNKPSSATASPSSKPKTRTTKTTAPKNKKPKSKKSS